VTIAAGSGIRGLSKFEPFDRPAHAHSCADQKLGRTAETQVAASAGPQERIHFFAPRRCNRPALERRVREAELNAELKTK
jgi:hypothetical protein